MLQTLTIETEVPDGYEAVAFRQPVSGEYYLSVVDTVLKCVGEPLGSRLVLRKAHVWPEWLPDGWVAVDSNGAVYWYENKPKLEDGVWIRNEGATGPVSEFMPLPVFNPANHQQACWRVNATNSNN